MEKPLSRLCYHYAKFVYQYAWYFIIVPILITVALSTGNLFKSIDNDIVRFYIPINADSLIEKDTMEKLFPENEGLYVASRTLNETGRVMVLVTCQDGGDILRPNYRSAVIKLNEYIVKGVQVTLANLNYTYESVCAKFLQFCHKNPQLYVIDVMLSNPGPFDDITYPKAYHGSREFYIANTLGGVTLDENSGQILEAKAWQLIYPMNTSSEQYAITSK